MSAKLFPPVVALLLALASPVAADDKQELTAKAQAVFKAYCYRCHGENGKCPYGRSPVLPAYSSHALSVCFTCT